MTAECLQAVCAGSRYLERPPTSCLESWRGCLEQERQPSTMQGEADTSEMWERYATGLGELADVGREGRREGGMRLAQGLTQGHHHHLAGQLPQSAEIPM